MRVFFDDSKARMTLSAYTAGSRRTAATRSHALGTSTDAVHDRFLKILFGADAPNELSLLLWTRADKRSHGFAADDLETAQHVAL